MNLNYNQSYIQGSVADVFKPETRIEAGFNLHSDLSTFKPYSLKYKIIIISLFIIFPLTYYINLGYAASSVEIDAKVDAALKDFHSKVGGGETLAKKAKGILMFPSVLKAGFWIGGQYGEGALRVNGETLNYYNIAGASFVFSSGHSQNL